MSRLLSLLHRLLEVGKVCFSHVWVRGNDPNRMEPADQWSPERNLNTETPRPSARPIVAPGMTRAFDQDVHQRLPLLGGRGGRVAQAGVFADQVPGPNRYLSFFSRFPSMSNSCFLPPNS